MENKIYKATSICIDRLFNSGNIDKAALANLRNSKSLNDSYAIIVWPIIFEAINKAYKHASKEEINQVLSQNGAPTITETAIYTALCCYAIFQQGTDQKVYGSIREENESERGQNLFSALRKISGLTSKMDDAIKTSLDRRVDMTLAMTNSTSIINSVVHLLRILKSKSNNVQVKIDFAQLASDLFFMQLNRANARKISLKWGQDYYYWHDNDKKENKSKEK